MVSVKTMPFFAAIFVSAVFGMLMPRLAAADTTNAALLESVGTSTVSVTVVKQVSGGTAVPGDFLLHLYKNATDVANSPHAGSASGTLYSNLTLSAGDSLQVVEEEGGPVGYDVSFNGDCNQYGDVFVGRGGSLTCTVVNTFVGTSTNSHHHDNDNDNDNNNIQNNLGDLFPLLIGALGGGGVGPVAVVPQQPCQPCATPGTTPTSSQSPSQAPGLPNTGAGGDMAQNVMLLALSLAGAGVAALVRRRA